MIGGTDAVAVATRGGVWERCDWVQEMGCEQKRKRIHLTCLRRVVGQNLENEWIGWRRRRRKGSWRMRRKDSGRPLAEEGVVSSW